MSFFHLGAAVIADLFQTDALPEIMPQYRATLTCEGLTSEEGRIAPMGVLAEFAERPWHENATCNWDGSLLWFTAENDYDETGRALLDEFGDALISAVKIDGTITFKIQSVTIIAR